MSRENLRVIFSDFNPVKTEGSFRFLEIENINCKWLYEFYFKWATTAVIISYHIMGTVSVLLCLYLHEELKKDQLYIPLRVARVKFLYFFGLLVLFLDFVQVCHGIKQHPLATMEKSVHA